MRDILASDHFAEPAHAKVYASILRHIDRGGDASPITLKTEFEREDMLADVGGASYLAHLAASMVSSDVEHYAQAIVRTATRRRLLLLARDLQARAVDDHEATEGAIREWAEAELFALAEDPTAASGPVHIGVAVDEMLAELDAAKPGGIPGVTWGLQGLDRATGGLEAGKVYVAAARPGMGKSALLSATTLGAARSGAGVAVFSLEMARTQYLRRMACDVAWRRGAPIHYSNVKVGNLTSDERTRLRQAAGEIRALPIEVDHRPSLTLATIRSASRVMARRLTKRGHPLRLIGIDYLGLVRDSGRYRENKVAALGEISQGVKSLAREMGVAILLLAQLNRENEKRGDKRPQLADLRGSGDIEQDADAVLLLHREAYYITQRRPAAGAPANKIADWEAEMFKVRNKVEVILAKQREGGNDPLTFYCDIASNVFRDDADSHEGLDF